MAAHRLNKLEYMKISRIIFLNIYAIIFALAGIAVLILIPPLYKVRIPLWALQIIAVFIFVYISLNLFLQWQRRLRVLAMILHRNKPEFHPYVFKNVMRAPCSRLLVRAALKDLGQSDKYRELLSMYKSRVKSY
jgi:hypothetical protein